MKNFSMRQLKISVAVLVIASCTVTVLMQLWHRYSYVKNHHNLLKFKPPYAEELKVEAPISHISLNEAYRDIQRNEDYFELEDRREVHMINTPGCKIPVAMIDYVEDKRKIIERNTKTCGKRAVFLEKIAVNNVRVLIKKRNMRKYLRKSAHFDCCYQFLETPSLGTENKTVRYTSCQKFKDGAIINLEADYIKVKCYEYDKFNTSHAIYDDVYAFIRKIDVVKSEFNNCENRYNILMLGMDSMSLPRFELTMPRTVQFFKDNFWLAFRGYHKVDDNTLPNLLAILTGKEYDTVSKICAGKIEKCKDIFIWSRFREMGYITAYGEDYIKLPDTFSRNYAFKNPPTHHYMKPFFRKSEYKISNKCLLCSGKVSSAKQLLNFALDFANTYRRDNFFGFFWTNSYSHDENCDSGKADTIFENFFNQLTYTGVLENTFVIFFSDHGIRFGRKRFKIESYYDDRLPILFIWTPPKFKGQHPYGFKAQGYNQYRFVNHYDLFNTLEEIRSISTCDVLPKHTAQACPKCQSLFEGIDLNRTCQDVGIHPKWCACHNLFPLPIQDTEGSKSVSLAIANIQTTIALIKTRRCWSCRNLTLQNVERIHFYYNEDKISLYYVVAFTMKPGNISYEATVLYKGGARELVGPISIITAYRGRGNCALGLRDRLFCFCYKINSC